MSKKVGASSYREVLNYLHNDLGISKEDVKEWVRDAIQEVAQNYVDHQLSSDTLDNAILRIVNSQWESKSGYFSSRRGFSTELRAEIAEIVADKITIGVR